MRDQTNIFLISFQKRIVVRGRRLLLELVHLTDLLSQWLFRLPPHFPLTHLLYVDFAAVRHGGAGLTRMGFGSHYQQGMK